jgi:hypothetical protein
MDNSDLPPIPDEVYNPRVCAIVRPQLAVLRDLPPERVRVLYKHVDNCPGCAEELRLLNWSTRLIAGLDASTPSAHVDDVIMAALAARNRGRIAEPLSTASQQHSESVRAKILPRRRVTGRVPQRLVGLARAPLAAAFAAVLLFAVLATAIIFNRPPQAQTFTIPASVSWSGYVLYYSETRTGDSGVHYWVDCYHNLGTNYMHVETSIPGLLDVVAIADGHQALGMDMMHHVAQWGAGTWTVDDSLFDLVALRRDIQANRAVYLGKTQFNGRDVYRVRARDGSILLLNMHYEPVNVLRSNTGEPIYDTLVLYPSRQISSSMWNMNLPPGFQMGTLPQRP